MRIDHISIIVRDIELSEQFYTQVMGFRILARTSCEGTKLSYLGADGFMIELEQKPVFSEREHGHVDHISISVEDPKSYVEQLKKKKVVFDFERPKNIPGVFGGVQFLVFFGPDGEKFELTFPEGELDRQKVNN